MPGVFETSILRCSLCADVAEFEFQRPPGYEFAAGQWFRLTLETAEGEQTKTFSHASAPHEPTLLMATRLSESAFKRALAKLDVGDSVRIQGPGGRLALPAGAMRAVFLTGGVGITPVRSLLKARAIGEIPLDDVLVVYGSRVAECVLYVDDLRELQPLGVRTVQVIEQPAPDWAGETGFIDAAVVRRHLGSVEDRPFVVTGPPPMVAAMQGVLDDLGVAPELRFVEQFGIVRPVPGP